MKALMRMSELVGLSHRPYGRFDDPYEGTWQAEACHELGITLLRFCPWDGGPMPPPELEVQLIKIKERLRQIAGNSVYSPDENDVVGTRVQCQGKPFVIVEYGMHLDYGERSCDFVKIAPAEFFDLDD